MVDPLLFAERPFLETPTAIPEWTGQMLMAGFEGTTLNRETEDLICNHHVGGLILFSRNYENPVQLHTLIRNLPEVASRVGYSNVEFRRGRIQDLALDLDALERVLENDPVSDVDGLFAAQAVADDLRRTEPMVEDESVDVVVSNCVLNLVEGRDKAQLFREIFRVLRRGGRAVISDIVSDEVLPEPMRNDPELWSGCVAGAFTEGDFLRAFEDAGFYGIQIRARQERPWRTVLGVEFRSVTVEAFKGKEGACLERKQAVIYRGPFKEVLDDDGHRLRRGERAAVCDKTFQIYRSEPYASHFEFVEPIAELFRRYGKGGVVIEHAGGWDLDIGEQPPPRPAAILRISRPERYNALDEKMGEELLDAVPPEEDQHAVRAEAQPPPEDRSEHELQSRDVADACGDHLFDDILNFWIAPNWKHFFWE
ncbi:MAG: methyltransferase domain-containing protein, partial [Nitrospinae bacterium]|nr:methyltransferase domain-containing protein [Nitrospinota bacterium]